MKQFSISFICFLIFSGLVIFAETAKSKKLTLHDFMEDYVEAGEKKFKKGDKTDLEKYLKLTLKFAPDEYKEEWENIVNEHLESGKLMKSCKTCHSKFKKSYKKTYKKKLIEVTID